MRQDLSKAVTDRLRACLVVCSAYRKRGAEVAAALAAIVGQHLGQGAGEPDFATALIVLRRTLEAVMDQLVAADLKLFAAQSWEAALRRKRDRLRRRLGQQIVGLRRIALGQWVAADLEGLGLQPLGARDPTTLLRRAELVAVRFEAENPGQMLGRPRFGAAPDLCRYVAEMKRVATALGGVVVEVNGAKCEVGEARSDKYAAMAHYDRVFLSTARVFEDLCRLAGKPDLAARVRPSAAARADATEQEPPDEDPHDVVAQAGDGPATGEPVARGMPDRSPHRVVSLYPACSPRRVIDSDPASILPVARDPPSWRLAERIFTREGSRRLSEHIQGGSAQAGDPRRCRVASGDLRAAKRPSRPAPGREGDPRRPLSGDAARWAPAAEPRVHRLATAQPSGAA